MAIRNIRIEGDAILRKKAKIIKNIDDKIKELAHDMIETMHHEEGVGIAGNQVGVLRRICIVNVGDYDRVVINPEILEFSGSEEGYEGCLSIPGYRGIVSRPTKIKVKYTNLNNDEVIEEAEDFLARAFCHEIDHLNGVLYIDIAKKVFEISDEELEDLGNVKNQSIVYDDLEDYDE